MEMVLKNYVEKETTTVLCPLWCCFNILGRIQLGSGQWVKNKGERI